MNIFSPANFSIMVSFDNKRRQFKPIIVVIILYPMVGKSMLYTLTQVTV